MKKRVLAAMMVFAMLFTCTAIADEAKKIKIGAAYPLTGNSAELGSRCYKGVKLAVDECNANGGINGVEIELVSQDDQADPKQAATIANLFASDDDIICVFADYNSSCTLAAAPIYNQYEIPQIAVGGSSPKITTAGDWTWRVYNSDTYRASFDLQLILDGGYEKIGILYQNDDFGTGALKVAQDMLAENGIEPLVAEGFLLGETKDFSTVITKMKDAECDAVFLIADETELAAFCTQCKQLGFEPFMSATGTFNPAVIALGGDAVEGMVGDSYWDPSNPPESVNDYVAKYKEAFDEDCTGDYTSPLCYDATNLIIDILKNGATTREEVNKALEEHMEVPFSGVVCDNVTFDEYGDVQILMTPVVIKDGDFALYEQ